MAKKPIVNRNNLREADYFDDYFSSDSNSKDYRQILFKPGRPLQTRELTQMQTILNEKGKDFLDIFFRNGSIVQGMSLSIEKRDTSNDGNADSWFIIAESGLVYYDGTVWKINSLDYKLTSSQIPTLQDGKLSFELGLQVKYFIVDAEDDENLKDPAVKYHLDEGLIGADRLLVEFEFIEKEFAMSQMTSSNTTIIQYFDFAKIDVIQSNLIEPPIGKVEIENVQYFNRQHKISDILDENVSYNNEIIDGLSIHVNSLTDMKMSNRDYKSMESLTTDGDETALLSTQSLDIANLFYNIPALSDSAPDIPHVPWAFLPIFSAVFVGYQFIPFITSFTSIIEFNLWTITENLKYGSIEKNLTNDNAKIKDDNVNYVIVKKGVGQINNTNIPITENKILKLDKPKYEISGTSNSFPRNFNKLTYHKNESNAESGIYFKLPYELTDFALKGVPIEERVHHLTDPMNIYQFLLPGRKIKIQKFNHNSSSPEWIDIAKANICSQDAAPHKEDDYDWIQTKHRAYVDFTSEMPGGELVKFKGIPDEIIQGNYVDYPCYIKIGNQVKKVRSVESSLILTMSDFESLSIDKFNKITKGNSFSITRIDVEDDIEVRRVTGDFVLKDKHVAPDGNQNELHLGAMNGDMNRLLKKLRIETASSNAVALYGSFFYQSATTYSKFEFSFIMSDYQKHVFSLQTKSMFRFKFTYEPHVRVDTPFDAGNTGSFLQPNVCYYSYTNSLYSKIFFHNIEFLNGKDYTDLEPFVNYHDDNVSKSTRIVIDNTSETEDSLFEQDMFVEKGIKIRRTSDTKYDLENNTMFHEYSRLPIPFVRKILNKTITTIVEYDDTLTIQPIAGIPNWGAIRFDTTITGDKVKGVVSVYGNKLKERSDDEILGTPSDNEAFNYKHFSHDSSKENIEIRSFQLQNNTTEVSNSIVIAGPRRSKVSDMNANPSNSELLCTIHYVSNEGYYLRPPENENWFQSTTNPQGSTSIFPGDYFTFWYAGNPYFMYITGKDPKCSIDWQPSSIYDNPFYFITSHSSDKGILILKDDEFDDLVPSITNFPKHILHELDNYNIQLDYDICRWTTLDDSIDDFNWIALDKRRQVFFERAMFDIYSPKNEVLSHKNYMPNSVLSLNNVDYNIDDVFQSFQLILNTSDLTATDLTVDWAIKSKEAFFIEHNHSILDNSKDNYKIKTGMALQYNSEEYVSQCQFPIVSTGIGACISESNIGSVAGSKLLSIYDKSVSSTPIQLQQGLGVQFYHWTPKMSMALQFNSVLNQERNYLKSTYVNNMNAWMADHEYQQNIIFYSPENFKQYTQNNGGTSGANTPFDPINDNPGDSIVDGEIIWTCQVIDEDDVYLVTNGANDWNAVNELPTQSIIYVNCEEKYLSGTSYDKGSIVTMSDDDVNCYMSTVDNNSQSPIANSSHDSVYNYWRCFRNHYQECFIKTVDGDTPDRPLFEDCSFNDFIDPLGGDVWLRTSSKNDSFITKYNPGVHASKGTTYIPVHHPKAEAPVKYIVTTSGQTTINGFYPEVWGKRPGEQYVDNHCIWTCYPLVNEQASFNYFFNTYSEPSSEYKYNNLMFGNSDDYIEHQLIKQQLYAYQDGGQFWQKYENNINPETKKLYDSDTIISLSTGDAIKLSVYKEIESKNDVIISAPFNNPSNSHANIDSENQYFQAKSLNSEFHKPFIIVKERFEQHNRLIEDGTNTWITETEGKVCDYSHKAIIYVDSSEIENQSIEIKGYQTFLYDILLPEMVNIYLNDDGDIETLTGHHTFVSDFAPIFDNEKLYLGSIINPPVYDDSVYGKSLNFIGLSKYFKNFNEDVFEKIENYQMNKKIDSNKQMTDLMRIHEYNRRDGHITSNNDKVVGDYQYIEKGTIESKMFTQLSSSNYECFISLSNLQIMKTNNTFSFDIKASQTGGAFDFPYTSYDYYIDDILICSSGQTFDKFKNNMIISVWNLGSSTTIYGELIDIETIPSIGASPQYQTWTVDFSRNVSQMTIDNPDNFGIAFFPKIDSWGQPATFNKTVTVTDVDVYSELKSGNIIKVYDDDTETYWSYMISSILDSNTLLLSDSVNVFLSETEMNRFYVMMPVVVEHEHYKRTQTFMNPKTYNVYDSLLTNQYIEDSEFTFGDDNDEMSSMMWQYDSSLGENSIPTINLHNNDFSPKAKTIETKRLTWLINDNFQSDADDVFFTLKPTSSSTKIVETLKFKTGSFDFNYNTISNKTLMLNEFDLQFNSDAVNKKDINTVLLYDVMELDNSVNHKISLKDSHFIDEELFSISSKNIYQKGDEFNYLFNSKVSPIQTNLKLFNYNRLFLTPRVCPINKIIDQSENQSNIKAFHQIQNEELSIPNFYNNSSYDNFTALSIDNFHFSPMKLYSHHIGDQDQYMPMINKFTDSCLYLIDGIYSVGMMNGRNVSLNEDNSFIDHDTTNAMGWQIDRCLTKVKNASSFGSFNDEYDFIFKQINRPLLFQTYDIPFLSSELGPSVPNSLKSVATLHYEKLRDPQNELNEYEFLDILKDEYWKTYLPNIYQVYQFNESHMLRSFDVGMKFTYDSLRHYEGRIAFYLGFLIDGKMTKNSIVHTELVRFKNDDSDSVVMINNENVHIELETPIHIPKGSQFFIGLLKERSVISDSAEVELYFIENGSYDISATQTQVSYPSNFDSKLIVNDTTYNNRILKIDLSVDNYSELYKESVEIYSPHWAYHSDPNSSSFKEPFDRIMIVGEDYAVAGCSVQYFYSIDKKDVTSETKLWFECFLNDEISFDETQEQIVFKSVIKTNDVNLSPIIRSVSNLHFKTFQSKTETFSWLGETHDMKTYSAKLKISNIKHKMSYSDLVMTDSVIQKDMSSFSQLYRIAIDYYLPNLNTYEYNINDFKGIPVIFRDGDDGNIIDKYIKYTTTEQKYETPKTVAKQTSGGLFTLPTFALFPILRPITLPIFLGEQLICNADGSLWFGDRMSYGKNSETQMNLFGQIYYVQKIGDNMYRQVFEFCGKDFEKHKSIIADIKLPVIEGEQNKHKTISIKNISLSSDMLVDNQEKVVSNLLYIPVFGTLNLFKFINPFIYNFSFAKQTINVVGGLNFGKTNFLTSNVTSSMSKFNSTSMQFVDFSF